MATDPGWLDKVMDTLENTMEFFSPGALTYALRDDGHVLAVAPSLLEMEDEEDGTGMDPIPLDQHREWARQELADIHLGRERGKLRMPRFG